MALAGFDFVVIDMEHSTVDFSRLEALIGAAHAAGLATLVRPWGEDVGLIGKVLDIGANGIMAPHVESPARARAIVEQARFAPLGNRGFSPLTKYDALGEPLRALGDATYVVAQIEGRQALANIAAIAAVPGIDAVFVGPYDLALSLGVPPGSPQVFAAAEELAQVRTGRRRARDLHRRPGEVRRLGRAAFRAAMRQLRRAHAGERRPLGRDAGEAGDQRKNDTMTGDA